MKLIVHLKVKEVRLGNGGSRGGGDVVAAQDTSGGGRAVRDEHHDLVPLHALEKLQKSLARADLLILDELNNISFNRHQSELLFHCTSSCTSPSRALWQSGRRATRRGRRRRKSSPRTPQR